MFNNRTDIYWHKLEDNLLKFKYEIISAPKDGHCFITAIHICLEQDHGMMYTDSDIKKLIAYQVYQNNNYYVSFYDGNIFSMLCSLDSYIIHGVYTHQVVDIAVLAAANIMCMNLCIYKKVDNKALLYACASNPPSTQDVYLVYDKEHYDFITQIKNEETFSQCLTFNITQEDVAAFAKIGASFHVTDPSKINGGKLYFVPQKDFCMAANGPLPSHGFDTPKYITMKDKKQTPSQSLDGTVYVQNEETLENGICDLYNDINIEQINMGVGVEDIEEYEDEDIYDMFADLDLSESVHTDFQFEEDNSDDEDVVLDNSIVELKNVTPVKPRRQKHPPHLENVLTTAKKVLNQDGPKGNVDSPMDFTDTGKTKVQNKDVIDLTSGA